MACCNSMPCSPNGHDGQDCCKTMSSVIAPFLRSPHASISPGFHMAEAAITGPTPMLMVLAESVSVSARSHAPPGRYSPACLPIRI